MRMAAIRAALEAMYFSGTHIWSERLFGGMGAVLMFHRVRPACGAVFQPNAFLEIRPDFLDEVIVSLRQRGIEIVSLDEACRRVEERIEGPRFVALTFDDGYRDNLEHAWPILKRHEAPFTIYVTSDFADGAGVLWWIVLERAIAGNDSLTLDIDGSKLALACDTVEAKYQAYQTALDMLCSTTAEAAAGAVVRMAERYDIDPGAICRTACMTWSELDRLARDPLVTIGNHTVTHPILRRLSDDAAERELVDCTRRIVEKLNITPSHLAYPHGGPREAGVRDFELAARLGFRSAVTTRPGVLFGEHATHMTALPRISVNGNFQAQRYLDVLLSGAPTTLKNRFRRVNAA